MLPKPQHIRAAAHCEQCGDGTEDVWGKDAEGRAWFILGGASEKFENNPGGKAFLCPKCVAARAPQSGYRDPGMPAPMEMLPPGPEESAPRRGRGAKSGIVRRLRDMAANFLDLDAAPGSDPDLGEMVQIPRAQYDRLRGLALEHSYREAKISLEDAILDALKSTGSLAQAEEDIAIALGASVRDVKSALHQLHRQQMVYPVGDNGWCWGQRPRGGFRGR